MIYLKSFNLLREIDEHNLVFGVERRNIFNNYYPIGLFSIKDFNEIEFDNITIFYGGNGSGKSTLLNIIAEKLNSLRKSKLEKGAIFDAYVRMCKYDMSYEEPEEVHG